MIKMYRLAEVMTRTRFIANLEVILKISDSQNKQKIFTYYLQDTLSYGNVTELADIIMYQMLRCFDMEICNLHEI